jgi:ABC-type antimicrobial peptide transport system permease subunit
VAIGTLALLISGVGIMNIMLASVAERTTEIGVRRAVGATRRAILLQLAAESTLLCVAGAVIGIPLGVAFAGVVAWWAAWPVAISAFGIAAGLALASATGLGFGVYPARCAARITPIEAMRAL